MIRSRGGCSWSWPAAWDWLLELGGRVGLVPGAGRLRGICPWSWPAAWESPLGGVAIVSGIPPPSVGLASGAGRPWNLPLEGVGLTSGVVRPWESPLGGVGFASFAGRRQQQRRIPRSRKTDTPSDLRFLKSPLWDLPLELFFRGNRPWSPSGKKNRRSSRTVDASAGRPVPSDPPPRAAPSEATSTHHTAYCRLALSRPVNQAKLATSRCYVSDKFPYTQRAGTSSATVCH